MNDPDTRIELPWTCVEAIGGVQLMSLVRVTGSSGTVSAIEAVQGTQEHGLIGAGLLTLTTPRR